MIFEKVGQCPVENIVRSAAISWSQDFPSRSIFEELKRTPKKRPQLLSYREVADRGLNRKAGPIKIDRLADRDALKK
jgi:hypothetical protein